MWELRWSRGVVKWREAGPHRLLRHLGRAKEGHTGEGLMQLTQWIWGKTRGKMLLAASLTAGPQTGFPLESEHCLVAFTLMLE